MEKEKSNLLIKAHKIIDKQISDLEDYYKGADVSYKLIDLDVDFKKKAVAYTLERDCESLETTHGFPYYTHKYSYSIGIFIDNKYNKIKSLDEKVYNIINSNFGANKTEIKLSGDEITKSFKIEYK